MNSRKEFYENFEDEVKHVERVLRQEDLTDSESVAVGGLERRLASLESRKLRLQRQMEEVTEQINDINARIASMKAT